MSSTTQSENLQQVAAKRYRIRIHGHLDTSWSERLGDLIITRAYTKHKQPMTILAGSLLDQAALSGVLNTLHELNYELISVENLNGE